MQTIHAPIEPLRVAANEAVFYRPPARLWNVTYHLRTGGTGEVRMISRSMAGAVNKVMERLANADPRAVHVTVAQADPC